MNDKRAITWKDADQNLCTIAASILHNSMQTLRTSRELLEGFELGSYPLDDGTTVNAGFAQKAGSHRSHWSGDYITGLHYQDFAEPRRGPSPQCWWCFQNLIRQRLEQARRELMDNRYIRVNKPKASKQESRNPVKRSPKGKYNRKPERE